MCVGASTPEQLWPNKSGRTTLERAGCKAHTSALKVFSLLDSTQLPHFRRAGIRPTLGQVARMAHSNGA
jgi:hypothetical protein